MLLRAPYIPLLFISLGIFIVPITVNAQSFTKTIPFTVSVSPQHPQAYSAATLSFLSGSLNLSNSTITVSIGGKEAYRGNIKPISIFLGAPGKSTKVSIAISTNGVVYHKNISITPEDVSIIVEPNSSVPPLYLGKPLIPLGGTSRVIAIANLHSANGSVIPPSSLSYTWTIDGTRVVSVSGIGRTTVIIASPLQYRTRTVSVVVQNQNGNLTGNASLSLSPQEPSVRIYKHDPLLGILFDHALANSLTISSAETALYGASFSLPTTNGTPLLQWFLNGNFAQSGNTLTLRPTGAGKGSARISLTASSGTLATANTTLSLSFGASTRTNLFGL